MLQILIGFLLYYVLDFISTVFFGAYPPSPLFMGY